MSTPPHFEWTVVEQEDEWPARTKLPQPAAHMPRRRRRSRWRWALLAFLLMTASSAVYALERTAQAGWDEIEAELQDAAVAEAWTAQQLQPAAAEMRTVAGRARSPLAWQVAGSTAHPLTVQVVQVEVHGAQALVQTVVTETLPSGKDTAYRTTAFYAKSAVGWVPMPPVPALLGPQQILATQYFTIHYYAVDTAVVHAIAPRLGALYGQASVNFGLAPTALAHPLLIEVVMDPLAVQGLALRRSSEVITVPSPMLLQLPVEQPAAEWLYQATAEPLIERVLSHTAPQVRPNRHDTQWRRLREALRLWQLWQVNGALADARVEVIKQVYTATPFPAAFAACRAPLLWQVPQPLVAAIRLELANQRTGQPRPWTGRLARSTGEPMAMETMVEYAVATYGVARLPALLHALDTHSDWAELIPAVYGVLPDEFEQGWRVYVQERYGLGQDTEPHP